MDKNEILAIVKSALLFKERFPNRDIGFEIDCGYFLQWIERFELGNNHAYNCMDFESREIWNKSIKPYLYNGTKGITSKIVQI